jgi:D-mannonate dehydratase
MRMIMRWFGTAYDSVTLAQIRQIPGITGIFSSLYGTRPGEVWDREAVLAMKNEIEDAGFRLAGVESVNIHDSIKTGGPERDRYIESIMPVCDKYDINMAIHPDDPAWPVFGLPRIVKSREDLLRIAGITGNPHHGLTLCTGSLGTNPANDIPAIIHALKGRIHFAHVRNVRHTGSFCFEESAHASSDGSLDMFAIMKTLYDTGFKGPIRPDHGRAIWDEVSMPGYGLFDRALGISYLSGLWEAICKADRG